MIDFHVMLLPRSMRGLSATDVPGESAPVRHILSAPEDRAWVAQTGVDSVLRAMDDQGVETAVAMGWPWRSNDMCRRCNDYVLEAADRHPGRFVGLGVVNPLCNEAAIEETLRVFSHPACIGLKLKAQWQGWQLDDLELLAPLADLVREHKKLFMLHVSHPYQVPDGSHPHQLHAFLDAHSDVPVVASHLGGLYGFYYLHDPFRHRFENLYFDIAFQSFSEIMTAYLQFLPSGRILFGTDHPFIPMNELKEKLIACGLDEATLESIVHQGAADLLARVNAPL